MKCLISITKLPNLTLLYFFLLFLFKVFLNFIKKEFRKNNNNIKDDNFRFLFLIFMCLGECLSIVYFIIRYLKTKNEKDELNNENFNIQELSKSYIFYINNYKNDYHNFGSFFSFLKDYKIILIIFLISLSDFINSMFLFKYAVNFYGVSGLTGLILYKILFKYQIYKHHILSIIILVISSIVQIIISFLKQSKSDKEVNYATKTIFETIYNIFVGMYIILIKYLIDIKHIESLIILFLQGIFELLISIFYYFIFNFNNIIIYIKQFFSLNLIDYLLLILFLICVSFYNVLIYLLSENTPSIYNLFIFNMAVYFSYFIFNSIKEYLKGLLLITFILNIINIIAMLIFVEFFVLNFCGLNFNCRISIRKREIEEKKIID